MYVAAAVAASGASPASAWGLARAVTEPRWAGPIYAVAVVSSIPFALTSRAYLDNALADGMMRRGGGGGAAGGRGPRSDPGRRRPAGRHAGHALADGHAASSPSSRSSPSACSRPRGRTAARGSRSRRLRPHGVGTIAVGGLGIGGIPLLMAPGANTPTQGPGTLFRLNVERLLPAYRLKLKLPLAAVGAAALAVLRPTVPRRRTLLLYAVWLLPLGVAALAYGQGRPIPLMRFFGTALALPLLGAAAFIALIAVASRISRHQGAG